jgi:dipeptidyl aminopeptidase/acylaminoacyl peptidase
VQSKYLSSVQWTPPPNAVGGDEYTITLTARDRNGGATPYTKRVKIVEGRIVFQSNRDGNYEIYMMNRDGTEQLNLTNNSSLDAEACVSSDGARIVFMSMMEGNCEIYKMNSDGTGISRLTNNAAEDRWPSSSPYGGRIAFTSNRDGQYETLDFDLASDVQNVVKDCLYLGAAVFFRKSLGKEPME